MAAHLFDGRQALLATLISTALIAGPGAASADLLTDCDGAVATAESPRDATRCYYTAARQGADWDQARARLRKLQRDEELAAWATLTLANMASDQGEEQAEAMYGQALEGFAQGDDSRGKVYTYLGLATFVTYEGRNDEAFAALEKAQAVADAAGEAQLSATVKAQRARQLYRRGEYDKAIALLEQIETTVFPEGEHQLKLLWLYVMGSAHQGLGRWEQAYTYNGRLVTLCLEAEDHLVAATALSSQVQLLLNNETLLQRHGTEERLRLARQALEEARLGSNPFAEAGAEFELGATLGEEGLDHLEYAVELYRELDYLSYYPDVLGYVGMLLLDSDPQRAFQTIDEGIALADQVGKGEVAATQAMMRVWMSWEQGDVEGAIADSYAILDRLEGFRDEEWADTSRARLRSHWSSPYYDLAGRLALLPGELPPSLAGTSAVERAFQVMERVRGRTSMETIARSELELPEEALPLRQAYWAALGKVTEVQRQILAAGDEEAKEALRQQLEEAEAGVTLAQLELARVESQLVGAGTAALPTLAEVQAALAADQALVVFQLAHWESCIAWLRPDWRTPAWALVVTTDRRVVVPLPDTARVRPAVEQYVDLVAKRDGSEVTAAAVVGEAVLAPVLAELPEQVGELVIVPDGALHQISLASIPVDSTALAERYAVTTTPSAALWLLLQGVQSPTQLTVLALADPEVGAREPAQVRGVVVRDGEQMRGVLLWDQALGEQLGSLPEARREARAAIRPGSKSSRTLMGLEATEATLKSMDLSGHAVLHLATHAIVDVDHPERSAVVLSPGSDDEDGLLQAREIAELELDGQLVVMSACSSATGTVLRGEGVLGLARAFFQGGSRTVVATLWPMRDDDAAAFFERFYRHLGRGETVAQSVSAAQGELADRGEPTEAWAGVVVLGDGDYAPFPAGSRSPGRYLWWIGLAGAVVLAWGLLRRLESRAS